MGTTHNLVLDGSKVARPTARRGMLRGELRERVGVCSVTIAKAFGNRPVGVVTARNVAKALGVRLASLLVDEPEAISV